MAVNPTWICSDLGNSWIQAMNKRHGFGGRLVHFPVADDEVVLTGPRKCNKNIVTPDDWECASPREGFPFEKLLLLPPPVEMNDAFRFPAR